MSKVLSYLLHVLLHANPIFVADGDATGTPFIIISPLLGIAKYLFGFLECRKKVKYLKQTN